MQVDQQPPGGFKKTCLLLRWRPASRAWFACKGLYRHIRIHRVVTRVLGPQYTRSRNHIEIDITYRCNLGCLNCNRSLARAPEDLDIGPGAIDDFTEQSIRRRIHWRRIRVLGGEPTLHPRFRNIVEALRRYRQQGYPCSIEVVTNGYGERVNTALSELPKDIWIENSRKVPGPQPKFRPFSTAPIDNNRFMHASFLNGCEIMSKCGMGLTPLGYYPCALAGGIDRIAGRQWGRPSLPDPDDDMLDIVDRACRLCGRFMDGHHIPEGLYVPMGREVISPRWQRLYDDWELKRRR